MEKQNYKEDQTKVGIEENIAPPRAAGNIMSWLRKPPKVLKMNSNVLQDESSKGMFMNFFIQLIYIIIENSFIFS